MQYRHCRNYTTCHPHGQGKLRQGSVYHLVATQGAELSIVGLNHSVLTVWPCARSVNDTFVPLEDVKPPMLWVLALDCATLTNQLTQLDITHISYLSTAFQSCGRIPYPSPLDHSQQLHRS